MPRDFTRDQHLLDTVELVVKPIESLIVTILRTRYYSAPH